MPLPPSNQENVLQKCEGNKSKSRFMQIKASIHLIFLTGKLAAFA